MCAAGGLHVPRHRHLSPTDQTHIREGVIGGAKRPGRDERRAVAGAAGDAVDMHGLNGLGEGHGRQDGGERPRQHRRPRPRWSQEQPIMLRMPGCPSALHWHIDIGVVRVRRLVTPASGFRAIGHGPPEPQHPLLSEQR